MFSHLKMNLCPAVALRERGIEMHWAETSLQTSPVLFYSWIPDGLTHAVVSSVPVAHRFQELPLATKKGANFLQQVVIDFTMTLESTIKTYFLFITTLGSGSSSPHWLSSLCEPCLGWEACSWAQKEEFCASGLLTDLWFLELFGRWICRSAKLP